MEARDRREQARKILANDADPSAIKQTVKQAVQQTNEVVVNCFKKMVLEFHKVKLSMWTAKHAQQWMVNLEKYALLTIGDRSIIDIDPMDIMKIMRGMLVMWLNKVFLKPIWNS